MDFDRIFGSGTVDPRELMKTKKFEQIYGMGDKELTSTNNEIMAAHKHLKTMYQLLFDVMKVWIVRPRSVTLEKINIAKQKVHVALDFLVRINENPNASPVHLAQLAKIVPDFEEWNQCFRMPRGKNTSQEERDTIRMSKVKYDKEHANLLKQVALKTFNE